MAASESSYHPSGIHQAASGLCGTTVEENEEDAAFNPTVRLRRLVFPAHVPQMLLVRNSGSLQQIAAVDQQEPESLRIKEEQEDVWTSLDGEQLSVKENANATIFPVTIKSVDDEEKPLFSQLHQQEMEDRDVQTSSTADQMTTETNEEETEVSGDDDEDDDVNLDSELSDSGSKTEGCDNDGKKSRAFDLGGNTVNICSCSGCGKQFLHKRALESHMTCPLRRKSTSCLVIKNFFRQKKTEEPNGKVQKSLKSFRCDDCGKIFNRKDYLNSHMRSHTGQKPFVCELCGQRFKEKGSLNSHMRIHTGQKPFACELCDQRFSWKGNLNRHMRIHTGQKPFVCELCGQRFSDKGSLNTHVRIHTGQKPFVCKLCGHRFGEKGNLNKHVAVHTGQKPFACGVCGHRFSQKGHLNRHMTVHSSVKSLAGHNKTSPKETQEFM